MVGATGGRAGDVLRIWGRLLHVHRDNHTDDPRLWILPHRAPGSPDRGRVLGRFNVSSGWQACRPLRCASGPSVQPSFLRGDPDPYITGPLPLAILRPLRRRSGGVHGSGCASGRPGSRRQLVYQEAGDRIRDYHGDAGRRWNRLCPGGPSYSRLA